MDVHTSPATNRIGTPSLVINHSFDHPPYDVMITAAIGHLNDSDGSSRTAIDRYIESTYTNLPPTHSALLDSHLKRLKDNGVTQMDKDSYKLADSKLTPKRGRGRPAKITPMSSPNVNANPTMAALGIMDVLIKGPTTKRGRGRGRLPMESADPSKGKGSGEKSMYSPLPKAKEASSGGEESDKKSTDSLVKNKGRGRPSKNMGVSLVVEGSGDESLDSLFPLAMEGPDPRSKSREESSEEEQSCDDDDSTNPRLPMRNRRSGRPLQAKKASAKGKKSSDDKSMDSPSPARERKRWRPLKFKIGNPTYDESKKGRGLLPGESADFSEGKVSGEKSMDSPSPKSKEGSSEGEESDKKSTDSSVKYKVVKYKVRGRPFDDKGDSLAVEGSDDESLDSPSLHAMEGSDPRSKSREELSEEEQSCDDDESMNSRLPMRKRGAGRPLQAKKESAKGKEYGDDKFMDFPSPARGKKRGRPLKAKTGDPAATGEFKKGRGRPRKVLAQDSDLEVVSIPSLFVRHLGRQSREVEIPKINRGSAGRPRKQSKIKEAVSILMMHLTDEKVITAAKALRELEKLAVMDLNAPFPVEE